MNKKIRKKLNLNILVLVLENIHHQISCEMMENEYFVMVNHPITKEHYISFVAYLTSDQCELVKLYSEQNIEVRF